MSPGNAMSIEQVNHVGRGLLKGEGDFLILIPSASLLIHAHTETHTSDKFYEQFL